MKHPGTAAFVCCLSLAACGCRGEEVRSDGPSAASLAALGTYAVETGTYDIVCVLAPKGSFDPDWIPVLSEEQGDLDTRVRAGKRRFRGKGSYLRLPDVGVEPGLELDFDIVDKDALRDDLVGEVGLTIGSTWPATADAHRVTVTCHGLSEGQASAAASLSRQSSGELDLEAALVGGSPLQLTEASIRSTALHCGLEALARAYPDLRPSLWTEVPGHPCAVEVDVRNTSETSLRLELGPGLRVELGESPNSQVLELECRAQGDTPAPATLVAVAETEGSALIEFASESRALSLPAGGQARLLLRGVDAGRVAANRTPGVVALGVRHEGVYSWFLPGQ